MKKITLACIAFASTFFAVNSFGQYNQLWNMHYQHTILPGYSNEGRRIAEDAAGNIFMLADVSSDVDLQGVHGNVTFHYVTINKYSTNGVVLSTVNIDVQKQIVSGNNLSSAFGLELDATGNVYVGYSSWSSASSFDVVLQKFNNNLVPVWKNTYGSSGTDVGVDLKLLASGTLYAVIKTTNITTSYSLIKSVPSNSSALLVYAYLANGAVINSLALSGAQRAYLAGYTIRNGNKNAYVAEINISNNTLVWGSTYSPMGINDDDVANKITVGVDGKIYTVGTSYQGGLLGNQVLVLKNSPGNAHFDFALVLKTGVIKNSGLLINASESGWVYVGSVADSVVTLFRIPSNGIFTTPGKLLLNLAPASPYNFISGVSLTSMKISTGKNIYITGGIAANGPAGDFVSSYLYKASVVFGNTLVKVGGVTVEGDFDKNYEGIDLSLDYSKADVYWVRNYWDDVHNEERVEMIDVNVPSPLREAAQMQGSNNSDIFSINPNPAWDHLTIQSEENITSVEVLDITGKRVLFAAVESKQKVVDVSSLNPGIYFCKVLTDAGEMIKKLVIN